MVVVWRYGVYVWRRASGLALGEGGFLVMGLEMGGGDGGGRDWGDGIRLRRKIFCRRLVVGGVCGFWMIKEVSL